MRKSSKPLLTNYNREWRINNDESIVYPNSRLYMLLTQIGDDLRREERPDNEMGVWEAWVLFDSWYDLTTKKLRARSTSAAPTYFEPYTHPATKRMYIDSGMERNNPVGIADSERQFIWPTKTQNSRDIIISIGAGYSNDFNGASANKRSTGLSKTIEGTGFGKKLARLKVMLKNSTDC